MMGRCARVAALLSLCVVHAASALGLGEIDLRSALNQPLRAQIPLLGVGADDRSNVNVQIASPEAFARVGLERAAILGDVRIRIVDGANDDQSVLELTTAQIVREPYLSLLLEVESSGARVLREYTVLLDPPVITPGQSRAARPAYPTSGSTREATTIAAQPAAINAPGRSYGPVQAQETLWRIAYNLRPDPRTITMDQMQVAIYRANPEAFEGDIRHIRSGSYLRIPSAEEIRRIDPTLAKQEVTRERRASRQTLREEDAGALMSRSAPAPTRPRPRAAPKPRVEAEPASPTGQLRLTPPATSANTAAAPVQSQASVPEASPSTQPEAGTSLIPPPPVSTAPQAMAPVQVRDNSMKALELLATHAREAASRGEAAPVTSIPAQQPATSATPAAPVPSTTDAGTASNPAQPATSPFVDEQPATPAPAAAPAGTPDAQAPGGVDASANTETVDVWADGKGPPSETKQVVADDSIPSVTVAGEALNPTRLILGGLLLLLLIVGLVQYRKRRSAKPVKLPPLMPLGERLQQPPGQADTQQIPVLAATRPMPAAPPRPAAPAPAPSMTATVRMDRQPEPVAQPVRMAAPALNEPAASTSPSDPYADVLAEADIHIAYGLYDEAARLLEAPLAKSPQRSDLHLKMLEVYFSAGQASEFLAQAQKLRQLVRGTTDPDWEKASIMGRQLCPDSELFADSGGASTLGASADLDISSLLTPETPSAATPAAPVKPAVAETLDWQDLQPFEMDKAPAPAAPVTAPSLPETLDFDLGDFKLDAPAPSMAPASVDVKHEPASDPFPGLDIDLSDFDVPAAPSAPAPPPSAAPAKTASAEPEITLDSFGSASGSTFDTGDDPLLSGGGSVDAGQFDTRLDLARAYIDMGEPAMAQSLLQEVMGNGNTAQKQEAQDLLKRIPT